MLQTTNALRCCFTRSDQGDFVFIRHVTHTLHRIRLGLRGLLYTCRTPQTLQGFLQDFLFRHVGIDVVSDHTRDRFGQLDLLLRFFIFDRNGLGNVSTVVLHDRDFQAPHPHDALYRISDGVSTRLEPQ